MKRNYLVITVLVAACGGGNKDVAREGELGAAKHESNPNTHSTLGTQVLNPAAVFRKIDRPGAMFADVRLHAVQQAARIGVRRFDQQRDFGLAGHGLTGNDSTKSDVPAARVRSVVKAGEHRKKKEV